MKKLTKKSVMASYEKVVKVGYCELQHLLACVNQVGYTCGVYGWNTSVFQVDAKTAIVTGYRPFGNIDASHELCKKYDKKAEELGKKLSNFDELKIAFDYLLTEFVKEVEKMRKINAKVSTEIKKIGGFIVG